MSDRRLVVWAFLAIIAASEMQGGYLLVLCGYLRSTGQPAACPNLNSELDSSRESLIAGVLGLLAGFAGATGDAP